jgi:NADPH2:quinone reductase
LSTFNAFRIFKEENGVRGRIVPTTIDDLTPGGVVIAAAFSSVNYKDALAATGAGKILRRFPLTGGIDVAGVVEASDDGRFRPGDRVLATGYDLSVTNDGGYAERVRVPADWVVPLPEGLDLFEAMTIGTAGFTAGLSIVEMERNGLAPGRGPVLVTGATGGVGSLAIACLTALGYQVTAFTRKDAAHDYLRSLGAKDIVSPSVMQTASGPLGPGTWAGAIDAVGGDVLAWALRTTAYRGSVAATGLTGGVELHTTVLPFILRGVKLLGIDSAMCPMDVRQEVWRRLGRDMKPAHLKTIAQEITMQDLPGAFETLLKGEARGRFVVSIAP